MSRHPSGIKRGIAPDLLLSQVKNTIPYALDDSKILANFPPAQVLKKLEKNLENTGKTAKEIELSHFEYFELCLSCHYLTVASPVPTDVDNQIRYRLWPKELPAETALQMAKLTLESRKWDFSLVTQRIAHGLSGHLGEWYTVAAGAYCALEHYKDQRLKQCREELFQAIGEVTELHSEVFGRLMREGQGLECLKASAPIAHNLGDMDRVIDIWELAPFDPLRLKFYKLGIKPFDADNKLRYLGRLWVAGELYKSAIDGSSMAKENHRHFALRKPRCLRRSKNLMIQTGPFLDAWGRQAAQTLHSPEERLEVVNALNEGWARLPGTIGYGRALMGMREIISDLDIGTAGGKPKTLKISEAELEKIWNESALRWIDEIPSKA